LEVKERIEGFEEIKAFLRKNKKRIILGRE